MTDKLTRDEVNRYIHEKIRGLCWHDYGQNPEWQAKSERYYCPKCGQFDGYGVNMGVSYCSDDSPRSLLNEVVATVIVTPKGWNALYRHVNLQLKHHQQIIEATAEMIARACVEAWEATENE